MSSVQLNVYGAQDEVTGTLVLTVHDPLAEVSSIGFYVTDGSGTRSARLAADRTPSPGVYEKDVLLDLHAETLIEPDVALTSGAVLKPGAESFSRNSAEMGRLQVGPGVETWMHNPYADEVGAPTAHISRLEVGGKKSVNGNQPAILRIHQAGTGAAEFFKPRGTTLELRETPGGNGTWFNHFLVNGASVRATGHIQADSYSYAHWNTPGWRLRMGEIYGVAGLYTPDSQMRFEIGGTGPFRFTVGNAEKMSVHGDGWMHLHGGLHVSRSNATGGGIVLAEDGDIVDLNDGYCSMRFSNGVRIFSGNRQGSPVVTLASNGQVHANALYVNTSAGQIRTDLGHATDILFANTNRRTAMWVGNGPTFETGPRIGFYGDSNTFRAGEVWFTIGGDANPADPGIRVERRTPGAYKALATLCDKDGNATWTGTVTASNIAAPSARALKENIAPFTDDALRLVEGIRVASFNYIADPGKDRHIGFIADDTDELFSGRERDRFNLPNTIGVLIRAVQQLGHRVEQLEQRA